MSSEQLPLLSNRILTISYLVTSDYAKTSLYCISNNLKSKTYIHSYLKVEGQGQIAEIV